MTAAHAPDACADVASAAQIVSSVVFTGTVVVVVMPPLRALHKYDMLEPLVSSDALAPYEHWVVRCFLDAAAVEPPPKLLTPTIRVRTHRLPLRRFCSIWLP